MKNYARDLLNAIKNRIYRGAKTGPRAQTGIALQSKTRFGLKKKHAGLHWYASLILLSARWYAGILFYRKHVGNVPGRRYSPERALTMKRRYIAGITAFIIVITFVLSISLFNNGNNVYASNNGETQQPAETPQATADDSAQAPQTFEAYAAGEDMAKAWADPASEETQNVPAATGMDETQNAPAATGTNETQTAAVTTDTGLVPGCHDPRIVDIQSRLMALDYMDPDEPTDYYGWGTKYAIELFQRKNGLQIDGLIGQQTLTLLFADNAAPYTITKGDYGTDVKEIQQRLIDLKYMKSTVTGHYGTDTETAVKAFQKTNGISVDGCVGEDTREALLSREAKPAPEPKPVKKPTKPAKNSKPAQSPPKTTSDNTASDNSNDTAGNPDQSSVDKLISIAKSYLGCRYVGGGKGPHTFDCSGFVYYCLNKAGYKIDYMVARDWARCDLPKVSKMDDMKPGDIICYSPHHVAIYIGGGQMIDASSSNGKVVLRSCDSDYWHSHFICARRVF